MERKKKRLEMQNQLAQKSHLLNDKDLVRLNLKAQILQIKNINRDDFTEEEFNHILLLRKLVHDQIKYIRDLKR